MIILLIISFFVPFLQIGSFILPISYIVIAFTAFMGFIDILKKRIYKKIIFFFTIYLVYTTVVLLFNFVINSHFDLRGISGATIGFAVLSTSHYLSSKLIHFNYSKVVRLFNYPIFINNIIIVLLFNVETFRNIFYGVISVNPRMFDYHVQRYSGLSYDGFSFASTLNAIYFLILFFIILSSHKKILVVTKYFTVVNLLFTFFTTILVGRTGVGLIFIGIVLLLLSQFYFSSTMKKIEFLMSLSIRLFILSIIVIFIYNLTIDLPMFQYLTYGFKFYSESFNTGEISDNSINEIRDNMFFLPGNIISIFLGEGNFGRGSKYIASDLGLILGIHGYGIIGIFLFLLSIFSFIYFSTLNTQNKFSRTAVYIITSLLILVNLKDYYIFYPVGHYILLFTFVMYLKEYEYQK